MKLFFKINKLLRIMKLDYECLKTLFLNKSHFSAVFLYFFKLPPLTLSKPHTLIERRDGRSYRPNQIIAQNTKILKSISICETSFLSILLRNHSLINIDILSMRQRTSAIIISDYFYNQISQF